MEERKSSGVAALDEMLGGGLIAGSTCVVSGAAGTGKTVAALQFALAGAERGERCVFLVTDEKARHVGDKAAFLQRELDPETVRTLDASPYLTAVRGGKVQDPRMLVADLVQQVKTSEARRLVVDGLGTLVPDDVATRPFVRSLFRSLEDNLGCTVVLTLNPEAAPPMVAGLAESLASTVIHLVHAAEGGGPRRLVIRKSRSSDVEPHAVPFRLLRGRGMVLEDGGRVPVAAAQKQRR